MLKKIRKGFFKKDARVWRDDLKLWQEKRFIFWIIPYYFYCIWKEGYLRTSYSLFERKKKKAVYIYGPAPQPVIKVGRREFQEKYKGNKWMIPINKVLDLSKP